MFWVSGKLRKQDLRMREARKNVLTMKEMQQVWWKSGQNVLSIREAREKGFQHQGRQEKMLCASRKPWKNVSNSKKAREICFDYVGARGKCFEHQRSHKNIFCVSAMPEKYVLIIREARKNCSEYHGRQGKCVFVWVKPGKKWFEYEQSQWKLFWVSWKSLKNEAREIDFDYEGNQGKTFCDSGKPGKMFCILRKQGGNVLSNRDTRKRCYECERGQGKMILVWWRPGKTSSDNEGSQWKMFCISEKLVKSALSIKEAWGKCFDYEGS